MDDGDFAFWTFSLDRYRREGVAETCLWMQDRHGVDVNILLACLFSGNRGQRLSSREIEGLANGPAGEWHRGAVVPLRSARVFAKSRLDGPHGASIAELRSRLKTLELDAEKLEQRMIAAALDAALGDGAPRGTATGTDPRRVIARENTAAYLALLGVLLEGEVSISVDRLIEACVDEN